MTDFSGTVTAFVFALLVAPATDDSSPRGDLELIFDDGFENIDVLDWSGAVGLAEGQICVEPTITCLAPLLCCAPCPPPVCDAACTQPVGGSCPP